MSLKILATTTACLLLVTVTGCGGGNIDILPPIKSSSLASSSAAVVSSSKFASSSSAASSVASKASSQASSQASSAMAMGVGKLLWEDSFDSFNSNHWGTYTGDGCPGLCGWGNQELQWYDPNNVSIQNGSLILTATRSDRLRSGKISSKGKVTVQYGLIEAKISTPAVGVGLWPAFWMLGNSPDTWPRNGELDIMEMGHSAGSQYFKGSDPNSYTGANAIFYSSAACVKDNPTCAAMTAWQADNAYVAKTPLTNRFVLYRMYWTSSQIRFSIVDGGVEYNLYAAPIVIDEQSTELQKPFYFLINLAVGGTFPDVKTPEGVTAPLPAEMKVDYVRVYEYNNQGQVWVGTPPAHVPDPPAAAETGVFGVYTDTTPTANKLVFGSTANIYTWEGTLTAGTATPKEGDNVIAWNSAHINHWFGAGINATGSVNFSNYANGFLKFDIKIPNTVAFKIGLEDDYKNQAWLNFPIGQNQYGLNRTSSDWQSVSIPISAIRSNALALQSMKGLFYIASIDNALPTQLFSVAIDNIRWEP